MLFIFIIGIILGSTLIQWLFTELASFIVEKSPLLGYLEKLKAKINKNNTTKVITFLILLGILLLTTQQVLQYYLFSGPYLWLLILSLGTYIILFLLPWVNLVLPFRKNIKTPFMLFSNSGTGMIIVWIFALINTENKIYLDESGGNFKMGNPYLSGAAVGLLVFYYLFSLGMLIVANQSYKNSPNKS